MRPAVVLLILTVMASAAARAQRLESVFGSRLDLDLRGGQRLSGELLALQRDSLWLLPSRGEMRVVALRDVTRAQVPQRGLTAGGVMAWTLIGGLVSGTLLTAACSSVEGAGCGGVLPAVMLSWGLVGGISAALSGSRMRPVGTDPRSLAPYARFPQGLPDGFVPRAGPGAPVVHPDTNGGGSGGWSGSGVEAPARPRVGPR